MLVELPPRLPSHQAYGALMNFFFYASSLVLSFELSSFNGNYASSNYTGKNSHANVVCS